MKKLLFVFNPNTGGGKLRYPLIDVLCNFSQAGYELLVCPTAQAGDAKQYVLRHGEDCDLLVCCGGDGTLNEVVDGMMRLEKRPLLGCIPGGTTNDFASSLRLPKNSVMAATNRILKPKKLFRYDVGLFNERIFNYVAAFGAFTDVSYRTPQRFKNVLGYFAYLVEALQQLPGLSSTHVCIKTDHCEIEGDFLLGMVTNSASVGGFTYPDLHQVRLDDGYFELVLLRRPHQLGDLGEISAAFLNADVESDLLTVLHAKEFHITSSDMLPWTLDGEYGGTMDEVHIDVVQKAIEICI